MRTPRGILLNRHEAADAKLDSVRKNALATAFPRTSTKPSLPVHVAFKIWRELIWPSRRIWTGLAAVWVFILMVNLNLKVSGPRAIVTNSSSADFMMAFREQEQVLAELTGRLEPKVAEPKKQFVPQPRSEGLRQWKVT